MNVKCVFFFIDFKNIFLSLFEFWWLKIDVNDFELFFIEVKDRRGWSMKDIVLF